MIKDRKGAHKLAVLNPYKSVVQTFNIEKEGYLTGIKNISSIPNTLMHKLEKDGFVLHTIDKKSTLAGRAVDTDLYNPITGNYMSGSSSGTAINVFAGINDLGIGNDGGGSVLAPAMCVNIIGFISRLIEQNREMNLKPNTEGMSVPNSIGFMARDREILLKAIQQSANKGYVRICNIAGASALCLPQKELGMSTLLMCESKEDKIAKMLKLAEYIKDEKNALIERYFLDYSSYFNEGYKI